jgi:transketolase
MDTKEKITELEKIAKLVRYHILVTTTRAGSGHPTSSLSATELMTGLLFGGTFRYNTHDHQHPNNDRLVFSKGHASPLLYALWTAAGVLSETDLTTYRQFGSPLEGHPTPRLSFVEAATGSLGQGWISMGGDEARCTC